MDAGILIRLGPLPLVFGAVAALAWYHFLFGGFRQEGRVVDALTRLGVAGARVWTGTASVTTDTTGAFVLSGVKPPETISFDAPGYQGGVERAAFGGSPLSLVAAPVAVEVQVKDAQSGTPLAGATAVKGQSSGVSAAAGVWRFAPVVPGERLQISAPGYKPAEVAYEGTARMEVLLQPSLTGVIRDAASGKPVPLARVYVGDTLLKADERGQYELSSRPSGGQVTVLAPGYRKAVLPLSATPGSLDVKLQPLEVKGLYFTRAAMSVPEYRARMLELLDTTEANAVVLDVKGDYGLLSYRSRVPLADKIGANDAPTIDNLDALLKTLRDRGVYTIARIVTFKDDLLARNGSAAGLDVAIKDRRNGQPWIDNEKLAWTDAFQPAARQYNVDLAREAIQRGFDEVQFDYVRFPTDAPPGGSMEDTQYSLPFTEENRVGALKSFLGDAQREVNAAGGFVAIDTFGYTTWWEDDGGIGQDLRVLADYVDYFSPMVYPSTFNAGLPGQIEYPAVVRKPYEVIYESLRNAQKKLAGNRAVIRPWLQYFDDYGADAGFRYDAPQIEAQKKAVADSTSLGWMLWDPTNLYRRGGLAPKPAAS